MIGQLKLLNRLSQFTFDDFPQSVIFEGDFGCGKHTVIDWLVDRFSITYEDISLKISNDLILDLYVNPFPAVYIIDVDLASNSKKIVNIQNSVLKFIEEPPQYAKIIILCKSKNQLLSTIQNRCQIFTFEKYSINELNEFSLKNDIHVSDTKIYDVYNTPGKLLTLQNTESDYLSMVELIDNIINHIHQATLSNTLTIVDRIDFGEGGYNIDIFLQLMRMKLVDNMIYSDDFYKLKKYYQLTCKVVSDMTLLNVNKRMLFENYLVNLKSVKA